MQHRANSVTVNVGSATGSSGFYGFFPDYFADAVVDRASSGGTAVIANVPSQGAVIIFGGTGFTYGDDGMGGTAVTGGTVNSITIRAGGVGGDVIITGSITDGDVPIDAAALYTALAAYRMTDDRTGLDAIFGAYRYEYRGNAGRDQFAGGELPDPLFGDDGDDELWGNGGNDTILGGTGNDLLIGGSGADTLDGGDGTDTAGYAHAGAGVIVDLATNETGAIGEGDPEALGDWFISIENLVGSAYVDWLKGDGGDNVIQGGGGDDLLYGRAGNDWLYGGADTDTLDGGDGTDTASYDDGRTGGVEVRPALLMGQGRIGGGRNCRRDSRRRCSRRQRRERPVGAHPARGLGPGTLGPPAPAVMTDPYRATRR